jgi:ATP-dependent protease ClpP protease subunit
VRGRIPLPGAKREHQVGHKKSIWTLCTVALLLSVASSNLAAPANADQIILKNGRMIDGAVISENDKTLTIEIPGIGMSLTTTISKAEIKTRKKVVREGRPYVVVPVRGVIGDDVTVEALRAGLAEARRAKPQYVVLEIDSPGGNIGEMTGMLDLLSEASKDLKIVAYVKRAYSAAAVIAMSCPQVYMVPGATIGATVPFRMTENGPAEVEAKLRSAIEARMRAANRCGGHDDLLIRGMSDADLELYVAEDNGKPVLRTSGPGKLIKSKGQILTLTTEESVTCGLAHSAATMEDLGQQICGGAWYEVNRFAYNATIATVEMQRQQDRQAAEEKRRILARQKAISEIKPGLDDIEVRAAQLAGRAAANDGEIARLSALCDAELRRIESERLQAVEYARRHGALDSEMPHITEVANTRASAIRHSTDRQIAQLRSDSEAAKNELALLGQRRKSLLANVPKE